MNQLASIANPLKAWYTTTVIRYNKNMKTKLKTTTARSVAVLAAVLLFAGSMSAYRIVRADQYDEQIKQLNAANAQKQSEVNALNVEADNIEQVIAGLQAQIDGLQKQINENTAKSEALKAKIAEAEAELAKQRALLGQNIKAMYLEGDISTLEMLASSKDLSDFVDKQQYRSSVKDKIKDTLDKITALKLQLNAQKEEVERLLKEQTTLQGQVSAQKAEQNRLLGLNQSQRDSVNADIKSNKDKINELKRQQIIENAKFFGGSSPKGVAGWGGYPWGNAVCLRSGYPDAQCPNYDWGYPNYSYPSSTWDSNGYGYRNCTSWVGWKVGVGQLGNAAQWPERAAARGYSYDYGRNARVGDAAVRRNDNISPNAQYGHVMYVEAVNGDGSIVISQYNAAGDGGGSAVTLSASQARGLYYIHF